MLASGATITYGGVLNLTNLSGALAVGSSFKLFQAAAYNGAFSSIVPAAPAAGEAWDASHLATAGIMRVVQATAPNPPSFAAITLSGSSLVLTGSNGVPSQSYYIYTSTNIGLPLSDWTIISTNAFDTNGNFAFTNAINPSASQQFFIIGTP